MKDDRTSYADTDGALSRSVPDAQAPPSRTFRSGRLLLVRKHDSVAYRVPRPGDVEFLLSSLTARDVAILTSLSHYRYLDLGQLEELFFTSRRRCERRLKWLRDEHLVHQWLAMEPPGWRRRDSVLLLSAYGAAVLAACQGDAARPLVRQAEDARDRAFHLLHDVEANGFFVDIAVAGRPRHDEGLYHWVGEEGCRKLYRDQGSDLAPDGWGRYLTPSGEIVFLLEWDRATSSPQRLRRKLDVYVRHFLGRADAQLNNVLFVTPDAAREDTVRRVARQVLDRRPRRSCCTFWTTHVDHLRCVGALGSVWLGLDDQPAGRIALPRLPAHVGSLRDPSVCLTKSAWWERRPDGGAGA
jgi:Replication-relaxation